MPLVPAMLCHIVRFLPWGTGRGAGAGQGVGQGDRAGQGKLPQGLCHTCAVGTGPGEDGSLSSQDRRQG